MTDHYAEASGYLSAELSSEWQRKIALETRALAAITANVAIVALFFSLASQSGLDRPVSHGRASGYTSAALIVMAISTLFATASVFPANYAAPSNETLSAFVDRVLTEGTDQRTVYEDTLRSRLRQIEIARTKNTLKAVLLLVSVATLATGTILFAVALVRTG